MASPGRLVLLLSILLLAPGRVPAAEPLRLIVLDVAEGQSVLLTRGSRGILIDTGHFGMAGRVVRKLARYGVERLDYLILTHLHPDHASGLFRIREAFPETVVADSGHSERFTAQPDPIRWVAEALRGLPEGKRRILAGGERLHWQGAEVRVLWPDPIRGEALNRNSLVLEIRFGGRRALIMGDADDAVERTLLERGRIGPVDILVAGHHGAADTGDPAFLEAVRPAQSVVSVNSGNGRGYPDPRTLERLAKVSGRVTTTAAAGDVPFTWMP